MMPGGPLLSRHAVHASNLAIGHPVHHATMQAPISTGVHPTYRRGGARAYAHMIQDVPTVAHCQRRSVLGSSDRGAHWRCIRRRRCMQGRTGLPATAATSLFSGDAQITAQLQAHHLAQLGGALS